VHGASITRAACAGSSCPRGRVGGRITAAPDVLFIPKPKHLDTRMVGSWVRVRVRGEIMI
jgi:hypothetical protein